MRRRPFLLLPLRSFSLSVVGDVLLMRSEICVDLKVLFFSSIGSLLSLLSLLWFVVAGFVSSGLLLARLHSWQLLSSAESFCIASWFYSRIVVSIEICFSLCVPLLFILSYAQPLGLMGVCNLDFAVSDDISPCGPFLSNLMEQGLLVSLVRSVDGHCLPRKRPRVIAPLVLGVGGRVADVKQRPRSIDTLPDECLFEILRRLSGDKERSNSACVSKRWLTILSSIRSSELAAQMKPSVKSLKKTLPDLNNHVPATEHETENNGFLTRRLVAEEATDIRLASIALGTCSRGGLGKLFIQGGDSTRVSDVGLSAIAHACPSLRVLSMRMVPLVTDAGIAEIADGCPLLEKLDLCQCPQISDKGLISVAQKCPNLTSLAIEASSSISNKALQVVGRCCSKLKYITIKDCPQVGDQGIASLVSSPSSSLERVKLQALNISDLALAVIGQYGKNVMDLSLISLKNVGEKGFWVMGNTCGLQKLRSITINYCNGLSDIGLQAIAKGSPLLKQLSVHKSCDLSDTGLVSFTEKARALENLHIEDCHQLTLMGVLGALLTCNPELKSLSLVRCLGIKDIDFAPAQLPSCKSLESLTIRNCPGVTSASLQMVGKICPQLQKLDFGGQSGVTDASLVPLIQSSEAGFVDVNLSGCVNVSDSLVTMLVKAHGSTLKTLSLDGCRKITDRSTMAIAQGCLVLEELDLSCCSIGDYGVAILASARQLNLRMLSLANCTKVTQKSLPFLVNMGQSMVGLNLQHCHLISPCAISLLEEMLWSCDIIS
ncbi:hypothetical protein ZIOFF_004136 [Zingiber officinale]|uniref:F-box domain-containing protein n=1 Tax=Zingiber officinale TaxID=94328 RepID=A0A8J5IQG0_ZINOF|nr:hypothetical protein ZIOFF_004136 [Zingiber officinale]